MIGILNNMIRHATRTEAHEDTGHVRVREERLDRQRNRPIDREALFRARGWGP